MKWYGKAADMGNAEAKYKLGKILWEEGKRYLQESCEQGNIAASEIIEEKQIDVPYIVFISPKSFGISARKTWNGTIEYSLDKINWHDWDGSQIESNIIYMRGCGNTVITDGREWHFQTDDRLVCRGNIETLLDYKLSSRGEHPPMGKSCYRRMFEGCTSLVEAPTLPATELADICYDSMFEGCTSLVEAPALPATRLASCCYRRMFKGCTSLVEAPTLPATELAHDCYYGMFSDCTSLLEAPTLPAMKLAYRCYMEMFKDCTSLKKAPALPARKLDAECYSSMFAGCTSLRKVSSLPAKELSPLYAIFMFDGCTLLKNKSNLPGYCFC